ncbi:MAG: ATP-binding cassette domain-containing protein [Acidimicrobiia bacterium]
MRATLRRILSLWRPHRWLALGLALALVLRPLFTVILALSVKLIIDRVVEGGTDNSPAGIVALLLVGYLVSSLASVAAGYLSATTAARILADVRTAAFEHLQRLSVGFHARTDQGDILSRFSSDVAHLQRGVVTSPARALESILALGMFIPVMAALEWRLTVLALVAMPVAVGAARKLTPEPSEALDTEKKLIGGVIEEVHENLAAQPVIRAYGLHRRALERFQARIDALRSGSTTANFRVELLAVGSEFAVSFVQLAIVAVGAVLALNGDLAPGALAAFVALLAEFTWEVTVIGSQVLPEITVAGSGIRRIDELLAAGPVVPEAASPLPAPQIATGIRFNDVSFSYGSNGDLQLDGVTLELPARSRIALVGPSGSGKSTLLNLLLRFYDPGSGEVLVDDIDLRQVDQADYRSQLGVVFQDTFLFSETLRENIRLARPEATDAEVEAAAEEAGLGEVAARLPEGLSTRVGSAGRRLSGGQRQRVGIARAVLRRPQLLLLDEVTSALDPATEAAVIQTLGRLSRDRTVVSVTHRLQAAADADLIVVMNDGRPVEQGSFDQLQASGSHFQEMWEKQDGFAVSADGRAAQITPDRLKAIPLFSEMDEQHLSILADEFAPDHFVAGEDIFQLGEPADRFHVIARGVTEVLQPGESGDEVVAHLEDGDFFGELAFLNDAPRNATVRAVTPTLTLSLDRNEFEALLAPSPGAAEMVRRVAADRMGDH